MPPLIISFDMNTDGPKSGQARKAFEDTLEARGWKTEIVVGDDLETLPNTTRVADRDTVQAKLDVLAAAGAAKAIEPQFALTKHVISQFVRVDSGSNANRPTPSLTYREFIAHNRR